MAHLTDLLTDALAYYGDDSVPVLGITTVQAQCEQAKTAIETAPIETPDGLRWPAPLGAAHMTVGITDGMAGIWTGDTWHSIPGAEELALRILAACHHARHQVSRG